MTLLSEPTVFENYVHDLYVDDQAVELSLWDTAGAWPSQYCPDNRVERV
jgi:Ras family